MFPSDNPATSAENIDLKKFVEVRLLLSSPNNFSNRLKLPDGFTKRDSLIAINNSKTRPNAAERSKRRN